MLAATSLLTADAGYHSEANLAHLAAQSVDALIADRDMRRRDERFATQAHHQARPDPRHDNTPKEDRARCYQPSDFVCDPDARTCI